MAEVTSPSPTPSKRAWRTALKPGGGHTVAALAAAAHASIDDIVAIDARDEERGLRSIIHFNPGLDERLGSSFGISVERGSKELPSGLKTAASDLPEDWAALLDQLVNVADAFRARRRAHPAIAAVHAVLEKLGQCAVSFDGSLAEDGHRPRGFMLDGWWSEDDSAVLVLYRNEDRV